MLKKTTRGMTAGMTRRGIGFAVAGGGAGYDTDAQAYITLVEAADSQSLGTGVKDAINAFVVGCKSDGIWDAIKAACIMAGARTLDGALVPLVGTAPQPYNFVSGDYDRKLGIEGDGATKYLDSNRNNNADPQNDFHISLYRQSVGNTAIWMGGGSGSDTGRSAISLTLDGSTAFQGYYFRSRNPTANGSVSSYIGFDERNSLGLIGHSRTSSTNVNYKYPNGSGSFSSTSQTPFDGNIGVFATGAGVAPTDARLSFYSIGESLDLALLDSRVSTLMTAIGAAIP